MTVAELNIAVEHPVGVLVNPRVRYASEDAPGTRYRLALPLELDAGIQRVGENWIVRDRETGIFGSGHDPLSAIRDFQQAAVDHLDVLERQEARGPELDAQFRYLRDRIRR